jgi:hypothetical protein
MITVIIAAAAVIGGALFLKWATWPCLLAFDLGRQVGRIVRDGDSERDIRMLARALADATRPEDGP